MRNNYIHRRLILLFCLIALSPIINAQIFKNEIPIPYLISESFMEIEISGNQHNFDPNGFVTDINLNVALDAYCYNKLGQPADNQMSYLGPTLIFPKGEELEF